MGNTPKLSPMKSRATPIPLGPKKWESSWEEANMEAKDGVILFGDDEHGYTLSYTFRFIIISLVFDLFKERQHFCEFRL